MSFGCAELLTIGALALALVGVAGCVGTIEDFDRSPGEGDSAGGADAGSAAERADAGPSSSGPETVCDDGVDDDGDGDVDCADADCALEDSCQWPSTLSFEITLSYQASSLAELAGYGDCTTRVAAEVSATGEPGCATCDRAYRGSYEYLSDDCPEAPRPTQADYALRFNSETQRELHVLDENGAWQLVGMATGAAGTFNLSRTDPVDVDGNDAGDMTTSMQIMDL